MISSLFRNLALTGTCCLSLALIGCSDSDSDNTPGSSTNADSDDVTLAPGYGQLPQVRTTSIGNVYVTADGGFTLYSSTSATPNAVSCDEACELTWNPLVAYDASAEGNPLVTDEAIAGRGTNGLDVLDREDDVFGQWMLNGYPLHAYSGDAAAGDVTGNGVDGVWYVARPIPVGSGDNDGEEISVVSGSVMSADGVRMSKDGFTLYHYANDTADASNCSNDCAATWTPLNADIGARAHDRYSLIMRDDNSVQWAYNGKALYMYSGDNVAGDTSGDGVEGLWVIAKP